MMLKYYPLVDYVVFNGMKDSNVDGLKNILLHDSEKRTTEGKKIQKSIMKAVEKRELRMDYFEGRE
jgi:hypothetical protein